ncbi:the mammalian 20s proteasome At 2.75 A resolution [Ephemerocybe angulata]|uniref:The mammalian 20s proteasome At 2.75 A resolution n=1 Tax=Ephemerocybe angulata TaxID=980116 RepID=A0A8H6HH34_9AGAR|nr:the mammalian 20s proteasome At 2.75 A resolution [Tulosesus angulatus]
MSHEQIEKDLSERYGVLERGVIVAVDPRATAGSYIASRTVNQVIEINPYILGTLWCRCYWETYLGMHPRLHELRNKERISVSAASKCLSDVDYGRKGMRLSMGTMISGWDKTGPNGSQLAYSVLNRGYRWDLTDKEAHELGEEIYAAGHRDVFSGNTVNLYHVKEHGWGFIDSFVDIHGVG